MNTKELRELEIMLFDEWYGDEWLGENITSPIEKIFYVNWLKFFDGESKVRIGWPHVYNFDMQSIVNKKTGGILDPEHTSLEDYEKAKKNPHYLIDFLITFLPHISPDPTDKRIGEPVMVAVELDGHDYHEKTKSQAKKDKQKDRFLQSHGYTIARFTGSEVHNDPQDVCWEIIKLACNCMKLPAPRNKCLMLHILENMDTLCNMTPKT